MKQNYYDCNGIRICSGDVIKVRAYKEYTNKEYEQDAVFLYYTDGLDRVVFTMKGCTYFYSQEHFAKMFLYKVGLVDNKCKEKAEEMCFGKKRPMTFAEEMDIPGLFFAWLWYIFIMAIAIIFNDCIGLWICASIVFFNYRSKKFKEAGYK